MRNMDRETTSFRMQIFAGDLTVRVEDVVVSLATPSRHVEYATVAAFDHRIQECR